MARHTQAIHGYQAIHGWPGPSADGLGPRLAPNTSQASTYSNDWFLPSLNMQPLTLHYIYINWV